jgi:hypothetical protein
VTWLAACLMFESASPDCTTCTESFTGTWNSHVYMLVSLLQDPRARRVTRVTLVPKAPRVSWDFDGKIRGEYAFKVLATPVSLRHTACSYLRHR